MFTTVSDHLNFNFEGPLKLWCNWIPRITVVLTSNHSLFEFSYLLSTLFSKTSNFCQYFFYLSTTIPLVCLFILSLINYNNFGGLRPSLQSPLRFKLCWFRMKMFLSCFASSTVSSRPDDAMGHIVRFFVYFRSGFVCEMTCEEQ